MRTGSEYNYSTFYVIAIVKFISFLEIFTKEVNCQKFDFESEDQRDSGKIGHAPIGCEYLYLYGDFFFNIFVTRQRKIMQKVIKAQTCANLLTHIHTCTQLY